MSALKSLSAGDLRVVVYQICYDPRSQAAADPGFNVWFNRQLTRFMENSVIADIVQKGMHRGADLFGVFSWRFRMKTGMSSEDVRAAIEGRRGRASVYSFYGHPNNQNRLIWADAEFCHPGIAAVAQHLFRKLGLRGDPLDLRGPTVYGNHFLCRPDIYESYFHEMLSPALQILANAAGDPAMSALLSRDANYTIRSAKELSGGEKEGIFGFPYYTYHPFVCERLFSSWLALNPSVGIEHLSDREFIFGQDV